MSLYNLRIINIKSLLQYNTETSLVIPTLHLTAHGD